jgi:hypothetical protein
MKPQKTPWDYASALAKAIGGTILIFPNHATITKGTRAVTIPGPGTSLNWRRDCAKMVRTFENTPES